MSNPSVLTIDAARYFGLSEVRRIASRLEIAVAERAFVPDVDDPQRDWVASVAAPAFAILRRRRGPEARRAFCSIGTGVGLDALAAIEVLEAEVVGVTDLFADVVDAAVANIRANVLPQTPLALHAGAGDLLLPLAGRDLRFDIVYENLPNLPIADAALLAVERTSASFVPPRPEPVPQFVADWLMVLHHLALVQARDVLRPGGSVISTLGARQPLRVIADMAEAAGLAPRFLTYGWKVQAVPSEVIATYADWQRKGYGPFYFYEADRLQAAFAGIDPEEAGRNAFAVERELTAGRLDAVAAADAHRRGVRIGHTVAVLESRLEQTS